MNEADEYVQNNQHNQGASVDGSNASEVIEGSESGLYPVPSDSGQLLIAVENLSERLEQIHYDMSLGCFMIVISMSVCFAIFLLWDQMTKW